MNFSGNITQILLILFIALLVFGPKKMVEYAYQAGKMLAKLRTMYEQTMSQVQTEMDNAGLGEAAKLMTTRFDVQAEADKILQGAVIDPSAKPAAAVPQTEPAPVAASALSLNPTPAAETADAGSAAQSADSSALKSAWTPEGYQAAQQEKEPPQPNREPMTKPPTEPGRYDAWLPN